MELIPITRKGQSQKPIAHLPDEAAEVGKVFFGLYQSVGYQPPWLGYFAVIGDQCIGTCGFKSPPENNRVEIAYYTFPAFEGKGMATHMAKTLVDIARESAPNVIIAAQTLPAEGASTTILKKLGFKNVATLQHPEDGMVWEWKLITK